MWTFRSSLSPCPYGIVVVVFHFDSGGRKAKQSKAKQSKAKQSNSAYFLNIATLFLRLTSCALNEPPLGKQDPSQKNKTICCKKSPCEGSCWIPAHCQHPHFVPDFVVYDPKSCGGSVSWMRLNLKKTTWISIRMPH